jgi:hypothetical protein
MAADASAAARSPWSKASRAVEEHAAIGPARCRASSTAPPSVSRDLGRRLREGHWDLAPATLIVAPLFVVGLQSYGGEGRYRTYLFALPWLCFFAAAALSPTRARLRTLRHRASLTLATVCLATCLLFA